MIASHASSLTEEAMSSLADGGSFVKDVAMEAVASDIALAVAEIDNDTEKPVAVKRIQLWMHLTKQLEDEIRLESENYRKANER